jgi:hypothetical protein
MSLFIACAKPEPPSEQDAGAETSADAEVDSPEAAAVAKPIALKIAAREPPEVTVLAAGRSPRADLVLRPAPGTTEGIEIVTKTRMSMRGSEGRLPPTSVPPFVIKGRTIIDTSDGKQIAFVHEVDAVEVRDDPDAPAGLVEDLRAHLPAFEAYRAELRIDAKGGLAGGTVHMPAGAVGPVQQALHQMTESFGQIQVPLPREPVGVGAKWRATVTIDQAGLQLEQTADYELVSREGDVLTITATVEQKLVDASFTPPGMTGVEATVTRFEARGTGSMNLDLAHLVPTRSEIEMTIDMQLRIEDQTQDMAMIVGVAFTRT